MELRQVDPENFSAKDAGGGDCFVTLRFLYEPVILEMKRRGLPLKRMALKVDDSFGRFDVLISLGRVFGIPLSIAREGGAFRLGYSRAEIKLEFIQMDPRFSGSAEFEGEDWSFSSSLPYIKVRNSGKEGIIVLPEGDGFYYGDLDRRESEGEGRLSLIGDPGKILEISGKIRELLHG